MSLRIPRLFTSALTAGLVTCIFVGTAAVAQKSSSSSSNSTSNEQRIQHVETGLVSIPMGTGQPLQFNLQQLMKALNVPGLTVTVIDDFKPAWTKTYGVTEAGTSTPVTPQTLFQAGSISKPVTATGALDLVEHGKLSLDVNLNEYLTAWKVPDNEFTATQKVTLRRLLSHSAGLTVHGFPSSGRR
jgi:CubicO group peptidase (beta-lactamase class C family)